MMNHELVDVFKWGAIAVGVFVGLIAMATYRSVKGQVSDANRLEVLDPDVSAGAAFLTATSPYDDWCGRNGFSWLGAYTLVMLGNPPAFIGAWKHDDESTCFCVYKVGPSPRTVVDIATGFEGDQGVSTCNNAGAMLFPSRPGHYKQALVSEELDYLWRSHREAVGLVQQRFGFKFEEDVASFEERFMASMQKSGRAIMARPFWPLRAVYWFLTQRIRVNRPLTGLNLVPPA